MGTEEEIIYDIIETVQAHSVNQDSDIDPRVVQSFMRRYRPKIIFDASDNGFTIEDELFQDMGEIVFTKSNALEYSNANIPKTVRLKGNFGIIIDKYGYNIPLVDSESFQLSKSNRFNKIHPKAKWLGNKMTIYTGKKIECCNNASEMQANQIIDSLFMSDFQQPSGKDLIFANLHLILENPSDQPGYNWRESLYPMPSELMEKLKNLILFREYNIILQKSSTKDNTTDGKEQPDQRR